MKDRIYPLSAIIGFLIIDTILLISDVFFAIGNIKDGMGIYATELRMNLAGIVVMTSFLMETIRQLLIRVKLKGFYNEINWMDKGKNDLDEEIWYGKYRELSLTLIWATLLLHGVFLLFGSTLAILDLRNISQLDSITRLIPYLIILLGIVGIGVELWRLNRRKKALASVEKEND